MPHYNVYKNIAERTGGSVYLGIVGPVRTGKSTFISKISEALLLPNINDEFTKQRIVDELPQSGSGSTIMTTQPKFVPETAVNIKIDDIAELSVRMIDCVGFVIDGVQGHMQDDLPRMVKTPWHDYEIPFERAAEIGTEKVIIDHSTIGIVLTTDGSFTGIPRENYISAEEKTIQKLKEIGKPFIIVINSNDPTNEHALSLQEELIKKHGVKVLLMDVLSFTKNDMQALLCELLYEFPVNSIKIELPGWIKALEPDHDIMNEIIKNLDELTKNSCIMRNYNSQLYEHEIDSKYIENIKTEKINLGTGDVTLNLTLHDSLFYNVLSEECDIDICNEKKLFEVTKEMVNIKKRYDKLKTAISSVKNSGYGIVSPTYDDFSIEKPELYEQNGKFGISIKASAPTLHMIRVDVDTEINPIIGSKEQADDFLSEILTKYNENTESLRQLNIFGKALPDIITDSFKKKSQNIPENAQDKLKNTLERVVNEGSGGMLFILL